MQTPSAVEALQQHAAAMRSMLSNLEAEAANTTAKINEWTAMKQRIQDNLTSTPNNITLNVGGTLFQTTKQTLLRVEGSYFHALLGATGHDTVGGSYFLDVDPDCFRHVLKFLRTGKMALLNDLTKVERDDVNTAMEYLKLAPPSESPESHVWGDHGSAMKLASNAKTVESVVSLKSSNGAIVRQPLVGSIQFEVATIEDEGAMFWIGLSAAHHGDLSSWVTTKRSICWWSDGDVHKCGRREDTLRQIKEYDRVTIRRGRTHVEFQLNTGAPFNIDLPDPTIDLFPTFATMKGGVQVTFLD